MKGKRYAILIAASKFPEEPGLTELRCPENDVDALHELLISPDFGQFAEVVPFKNAPSYKILPKLNSILSAAAQDDLVLVYYSGHGKLNRLGHLCLAASNTVFSSLEATSIPAAVIKTYFDLSDTRKRILILDCCYSGAAGAEFVKGGVDDQLQLMSSGQGTFIMTASTAFQIALEKEGDSNGLFTKHLLEGIRSGEADRNEDGFVDIHELYQHVYEKVRAEGAQEPMKWNLHAKGMMIVAKSGRNTKEQRRLSVRETLFELVDDDKLTPSIALEAMQLLSIPKQEMTEKDQVCFLLIEHLIGAKISPPVFMEQWWLRNCFAHPAVPELQKGRTIGRRYIDHGDGTITDTETGLMWKRCLEGLSGMNCKEGKVETYTWDEAVERFKNVEYAGYADWRLPTVDELKTLVHCSEGKDKDGDCNEDSEAPTINQQAFPNAGVSRVWSGSPLADGSNYAWLVDFSSGHSGAPYCGNYSAVRLVRGGQ